MIEPEINKNQTVSFHLSKSNNFRVVYADGVVGGLSPKGMIRMAFFNERAPFPQEMVHEIILEQGAPKLGAEVAEKRVVKSGIFREIEVDVVMQLDTAEKFHLWLGKHIEELKKRKIPSR